MKTIRGMRLVLTPVSDGRVMMSLSGRVNEDSPQRRLSLLWVTSLWARPEPLHVALSADAKGNWSWAEPWTEALADAVGDYEVSFALRGGARGNR